MGFSYFLHNIHNVGYIFQFPLWDSAPVLLQLSTDKITFNSLYGIPKIESGTWASRYRELSIPFMGFVIKAV